MRKTYQPIVLKTANFYIEILEEMNFFQEYEIKNMNMVKDKLCDFFTQKFIIGEELETYQFNEDEWHKLLSQIIAKDVFESLQKKGIINSYEDDTTEEKFFLTEKGRELVKKLKNRQ